MKQISKYTGFAFLICLTVLLGGCRLFGIRGNGNVINVDRPVAAFDRIEVSGYYKVLLVRGTKEALSVEADENLMEHIRTRVENGTLVIDADRTMRHSKSLKIFITFVNLKGIELNGAVNIYNESELTLDDLDINLSGAAEGKMALNVRKLDLEMSGGSKFELTGKADDVNINASGAVHLYSIEMEIQRMRLELSGAGLAEVNVKEKLDTDISGASKIWYKGNPQLTQHVSGAASIEKIEGTE